MDLVGPIIEILKCVGGPIVRYLKHQIKFNNYLNKFKVSKDDLCRRKRDIESRLGTELRHGKVAREAVQRWLTDVEEFIARQDVEDEVNGWGCLSCCCRVKILEERAHELKEIYDKGNKYTSECLVIDGPSASAVELPTSELRGNEAIKGQILACLKGEEVTKLGVWGMGGVGKTTIMKHVHNELLKEDIFKKIIWVTVSQNFEIYNLQEQIAGRLKEQLVVKIDRATRAGELFQMLKEDKHKPFLLILDDVWERFDLNEVGIPEPDVTNGCKLVLTTRSQEITRSMDCDTIKVETLPREEALQLFLNKVGDIVLSDHGGGIKKDLESTLKGIVDECDGLPLALITVAGSLKGIYQPRLWSVALNQLRDCKRNVAGTDADAFKILMFSYDRLKNSQIQYCFLYCALYPEDHNIPKEEIIEYWIDEGFIDEMETRHEMKDEGYDILRTLEENSLLELIENEDEDEDEDEGDCVRMHDLIRDMALHITRMSPRFLVEAGKSLIELPEKVKCTEDVEKVSLMHNYIKEIPSSMASSTCTRLTTLLLAHNNLSTIPESVFEYTPELKILDLSFNHLLRSLPNSVSKLVKLTTLLLHFTSLTEVPSLSDIRALKKLDLGGTKLKEFPKGLEMCTNLKYLDLSNLWGFIEVAEATLSNLSNLQQLFVAKGIALKGEVIGKLKKLEAFDGQFPTVHEMSIFLKCFLDQGDGLSGYFLRVGESHCYVGESVLPKRRLDKFIQFAGIDFLGENILQTSVQIFISRRGKMKKVFPSVMLPGYLHRLEDIYVYSCEQMEEIIASAPAEGGKGEVIKLILPKLKRLHLELLPALKNICSMRVKMVCDSLEHIQILQCYHLDNLDAFFEVEGISKSLPPPGICSSLKTISIGYCYKMKKLFPSWMLQGNLQSLEEIYVCYCVQMEEILSLEPEEGEKEGVIKLTLPKLKGLKLIYLPALKRICSSRAVMVCDSLEHVEILQCFHLENLDALFKEVTFSSLKTIWINGCGKMKKLFPSVLLLQSLEEINVGCCEQMEELVEKELGRDLSLPKLKRLRLECLPALEIYSITAVMICASLEEIQILACQCLRRIPPYHLDNLDAPFKAKAFSESPQPPATYSSLKTISIIECGKIKQLLPSRFLLGNLQSLEEIIVRDCELMEEIIALDPEEEKENGEVDKLILPKLKKLHLELLPAMKRLFPSRLLLGRLHSLEEISVRYCEQMEELVASDPQEGKLVMDLILPKLKLLELEGLPALKST